MQIKFFLTLITLLALSSTAISDGLNIIYPSSKTITVNHIDVIVFTFNVEAANGAYFEVYQPNLAGVNGFESPLASESVQNSGEVSFTYSMATIPYTSVAYPYTAWFGIAAPSTFTGYVSVVVESNSRAPIPVTFAISTTKHSTAGAPRATGVVKGIGAGVAGMAAAAGIMLV